MACAGDGNGSNFGSGQANGDIRFADHGLEPGEAFSELSTELEPGEVVEFGDQPGIAETASGDLCAEGKDCDGPG